MQKRNGSARRRRVVPITDISAGCPQAPSHGRLPPPTLRLTTTGRHGLVIRELEGWSRAGKRLSETHLALLEQAYRAAGREQDALRAASSRSLEFRP